MKNPLEALKMHLFKSARNGSSSAILFAQIALFTATIFVRKTRLYAEHDSTGFKTALSYQIVAVLVSNSRVLSRLGFIHRTCGYKVNSIANLFCLILAIVLEKFYEKSLSSLGFALSITVLFLILLVIIRPSTDLGLFGFLIGVIGSVAYNLFRLKFQTWIVVAICFPLLGFRCWLDKNWLEVGEDQSLPTDRSTRGGNQISKSEIIEAITVVGFHLFWVYNLFRTNCRKIKGPPESISCTLGPIIGMLACVLIFSSWFCLTVISRVYSLFQTEPAALPMRRAAAVQENSLEPVEIEAAGYWRAAAVQENSLEPVEIEAAGYSVMQNSLEPAEIEGAGVSFMQAYMEGPELAQVHGAAPRRRMPVPPLPSVVKKVGKEARKKEDRPAYKAA